MQGENALTNPDKMSNLNTIPPSYIATEGFPQLIVFACGWVKIENGVTKEYVDRVANDAVYYAHREMVEIDKRLTQADEELNRKIRKNEEDIVQLQIPQTELILYDENNNICKIFIKNGTLQMEVVE